MNTLYPSYRNGLLSKTADWVNDPIRIALYDTGAGYNPTHLNIADIQGIQIAPGDSNIAGKTAVDGFAIGPPVVYESLSSPDTVENAVIYRFSDGALVAFLDNVFGFAFQPVGVSYALAPGGPGGSFFAL